MAIFRDYASYRYFVMVRVRKMYEPLRFHRVFQGFADENFANLAILLLEHKSYSTLHLIIKDVCM